jgi:uncharacterized protein YprB with RNaseH-like and TPR domain
MTDLASRLRQALRSGSGSPRRELTYEPESRVYERPTNLDDLCAALTAVPADTPAGRCLQVNRRYEAERWHGDVQIGDCELKDLTALDLLNAGTHGTYGTDGTSGTPVFLDIETTGLSGGAGTVAFLVGCGYFDLGAFQIHQFLLPSYAAERALLAAVAASVEPAGSIVTYNGKTFDLPLMETRWLFHRMQMPLADKPHVDMLHPARRLWRHREATGAVTEGCNLAILERDLFGVRRTSDVPGFDIPGRYFRFLRSGNPAPLEAVLEHNRLDLVSLAVVTARVAALARGGSAACRDGRERIALGRLFERGGKTGQAERCYRDATSDRNWSVSADAWCRLALFLRRARQYADAADAWQQVMRLTSGTLGTVAREALAIHMEHRSRDLDGAHALALEALLDLEEADEAPRRRDALRYRLARLERKRAVVQQKGGANAAFPEFL